MRIHVLVKYRFIKPVWMCLEKLIIRGRDGYEM